MLEKPEKIIVFRKGSVKTVEPPSDLLQLVKIMPEFSFLVHVLSIMAIFITLFAITSIVLLVVFLIIEFIYTSIREAKGCDPIKVFIYKDRMVTHRITSEGFSAPIIGGTMSLIVCYALIGGLPTTAGEITFVFFVLLCVLSYTYFGWDKSYLIDFSKRKISRRYLLFNKPYETFDYIGGIDKVLGGMDYFKSPWFFYKLWIRDERYAEGVPLSGLIHKNDAESQKLYADYVFTKFGIDDRKTASPVYSSPLQPVNEYLTLKLKSGARITVSEMNKVFVFSGFFKTGAGWLRLIDIEVIVRNAFDENMVLMRFRAGDSKKIDNYIRNLSNTFSIQPEVILQDNRFSKSGQSV